jgi:hypothetical protein
MDERTVFINALEREDPADRAAYLDAACAGRPGLRKRVEELLCFHQEADDFLDVPALEQLADAGQLPSFFGPAHESGPLGRLDP